MNVQFHTPHQYLFYHENVKHLLLVWKKEHKRELYIAQDEESRLMLTYPGETYVDTLLHEIEPIFFQKLTDGSTSFPVILGATFPYNKNLVGMYYTPPEPKEPLYFFYIKEEALHEIPDDDYKKVIETFATEYKEYIS